jgi:hypothetical protein
MYDFNCAEDYYNPIVDVEKGKWSLRQNVVPQNSLSAVKKEEGYWEFTQPNQTDRTTIPFYSVVFFCFLAISLGLVLQ